MAIVKNVPLFQAVHAATLDIVRNHPGCIPTKLIGSDQPLLRAVDMFRYPILQKEGRLTLAETAKARTIFNEKHDDKRWSGMGRGRALDQGALYLSLSAGSLSAEMAHYARLVSDGGATSARELVEVFSPKAGTQQKALFRMRPLVGLLVVDFSKHNKYQKGFFERLDRDVRVKDELSRTTYRGTAEACRAEEDYSCSRGVALGLAASTTPAYDGILVQTARDNTAMREDGDNLALFGKDAMPHPDLMVECAVAPVTIDRGRIALKYVGYRVGMPD